MTFTLLSIMIGILAGAALVWGIHGTTGVRRVRRGLVVGLLALMVMTSWALWQDTFPATFGPFVLISTLNSLIKRDRTDSRT